MAKIFVKADNKNSSKGVLKVMGSEMKVNCCLGRAGITDNKLEGDGKTPIGKFAIRNILIRADRIALPPYKLAMIEITKDHIWCDDPTNKNYNKLMVLNKDNGTFSHEQLYRDDHKYDIILPLDYNNAPAIPHNGSAIFFHLVSDDYEPTQGCIAITKNDMLKIIPLLDENSYIEITAAKNDYRLGQIEHL